ncbi:MAG: RNA polymerase sigma factor [Marinifilaceae bacterium]
MKTRWTVDLSDQQLIQNYLMGDQYSIGVLYERYFQKVLFKCFTFSKNQVEAQDLAQEVLMKAFEKLKTFRGDASFSTWLYRITHNHCIEVTRGRKNKKLMELQSIELDGSELSYRPDEDAEDLETKLEIEALMLQAMDKLSETERLMLKMKYLDGNSIQELQQFFKLSTSAVKMRLLRAKQKVENQLAFVANAG